MVQLVLKNVRLLSGKRASVVIDNGRIEEVLLEYKKKPESDRVIEGERLLALPGLCNSHTHASMSLLRGLGEDMELKPWLETKIWPVENRMKIRHLEAGMQLACLEMIKTGTTLFNDMYFNEGEIARVVGDSGLRAVLGEGFLDFNEPDKLEDGMRRVTRSLDRIEELGKPLIVGAMAPHAPHTVSKEGLLWCWEEAERRSLRMHIHVSETSNEVEEAERTWGMSPLEYLDSIGVLGDKVVAAHCVHLSKRDVKILSGRGVWVSHNPVSNMKLSVGGSLPMPDLISAGVGLTIGTDGAASNNSLDMFESMKVAALLSKLNNGPSSVNSGDILKMATSNGYKALGVEGGRIEKGMAADLILLDLDHYSLTPGTDPLSDVVYSVNGSAVRYTIVNGRILMDDGRVDGEEKIIENARNMALELLGGQ